METVLFMFSVAFCKTCYIPREALLGCLCLAYANSMINPFVYAFSNKEFQKAIKRLLRCRVCHW